LGCLLFLYHQITNRSIVFIDGFDLYYGALRGSNDRWLDLENYFSRLRQDDDIQSIRYFTAITRGESKTKQAAYLKALSTLSLVDVVLGKFKTKRLQCKVSKCEFLGPRRFPEAEEKRTDVNIALSMLDAAYQDECDRFVLVSGDSDLVPAIELIKDRFPEKEVIVYIPARDSVRGAASELRGAADKDKTLPVKLFEHSQFSATVLVNGKPVEKPEGW